MDKNRQEYQNCYFRIESGHLTLSAEQSKKLFDEIVNLFEEKGWISLHEYGIGECPEISKGKSILYIHPQSLSGNVNITLVDEIEETLKKGVNFKYYHTDKYHKVYDWSDEEYLEYLTQNKENIIHELLKDFQTKRSNQVIIPNFYCSPIRSVCDKYKLNRLEVNGTHISANLDWNYVYDQFTKLVSSGKLFVGETNRGRGFRTASPKETARVQQYLKWCCENEKPISDKTTQEYIQIKLSEDYALPDKEITPIFAYSDWVVNSRSKEIRNKGIYAVYDENEEEYCSEEDDGILSREQHEGMQSIDVMQ